MWFSVTAPSSVSNTEKRKRKEKGKGKTTEKGKKHFSPSASGKVRMLAGEKHTQY